MEAMVTSLVAVVGTLLGSTVTHLFQQRSARRTEHTARQERMRQERMDLYGEYAGLLVEFRQAMLHHWFCVHEGTDAEEETALRGRSFETRSRTQQGLFRIQLVTGEPELLAVAAEAFEAIGRIDRAAVREEVVPRRDATRELIDSFVTTARRHL
ncbi:hypothetical protein OOK31_27650 [Streptomyces sp. NBC_00249]|uniref:hypothetical protein n=1 Tax=Streptomyces sp. NBC_00249 TaxID=2975690 RepID=UPI0022595721|nr:hypothetical protein [Streptomyces sp. NBC_00249]MCX5197624.1 hypothetical protein [Streptomyces sp. NBC_00249]